MFTEQEMQATIDAFTAKIDVLERELRDRELHHFETEQILARVKGLHRREDLPRFGGFVICRECGDSWPCATATLIGDIVD